MYEKVYIGSLLKLTLAECKIKVHLCCGISISKCSLPLISTADLLNKHFCLVSLIESFTDACSSSQNCFSFLPSISKSQKSSPCNLKPDTEQNTKSVTEG